MTAESKLENVTNNYNKVRQSHSYKAHKMKSEQGSER